MRLFPFRRPSLGLSIDAGRVTLAEVRRGWRGPALRRGGERGLPDGLLKVSASEPNVTDVSALANEVSSLLDGLGKPARPVPIALTLSDVCARVALHEFDALPRKPSELDGLIRWRVQKDWGMPVADTRVTYQTFRMPSAKGSAGGPIRVLVVAIRGNVIEPYEQACELAGLIPVHVGLASLQLFDLCLPAVGSSSQTAAEHFYLYVGDGSFAFLVVRGGVPVFVRIKPLRMGSPNGSAAPHDSGVNDELLATVQFYMEQDVDPGRPAADGRTLYLVQGEGNTPALPDSLGVTVSPIGWDALGIARPPSITPSFAGLPALAGVMET